MPLVRINAFTARLRFEELLLRYLLVSFRDFLSGKDSRDTIQRDPHKLYAATGGLYGEQNFSEARKSGVHVVHFISLSRDFDCSSGPCY